MIAVRRALAVGAVVSLAAIITCTAVWGDPQRDKVEKELRDWRAGKVERPADRIDRQFAEEFLVNRFGDRPLVTYTTVQGDTLAAFQLKPDLDPAPARPRDVLILIDTSASKAQGPLAAALKAAEGLAGKLGKDDHVAIWTVNTTAKKVTKGFQPAGELADAFKALALEFPAGAVNLKQGLTDAVNSFDDIKGRQRVLVFLGDGTSLAGPVDADDRAKLCGEMVRREIAFYAVPLGPRPDPVNIHGFTTGTGGKVVRMLNELRVGDTVGDLVSAFDTPILYPQKWQLPETVTEMMPTKLPPLRRDVATLVLCKLAKGAAKFDWSVTGTVAGKAVTAKANLDLPAPDVENFFLASMYKQWRERKDRPAMMQADRALAFAADQNQMARADLLAKAAWALDQNKFDPAWRLFKEAEALDPNCKEAKAGLDLVQKLRDGKIDREQLKKEFQPDEKDMLIRFQDGKKEVERGGAEKAPEPLKAEGPNDILKEAQQRRQVADQQQRRLVDDAITEGLRLVRIQPNEAHNLVKRTLDGVRTNPDISDAARLAMSERLERTLRQVDLEGAVVARNQADRLALEAFAAAKARQAQLTQSKEAVVRESMMTFHRLMDEGRSQQAFIQNQALREELIRQAQPVPQSVVSMERISLSVHHLKQLKDLVRLREEKWLAVLLEVERSHVPFPDEPPVEFPNAAKIRRMTSGQFDNWADFAKYRDQRYSSSGFGPEMPKKALELKAKLTEIKKFKTLDDPKMTLQEAIDHLQRAYDITIDVNERAFRYEQVNDVLKTPVAEQAIPEFTGTLTTMLKKILAKIPVPSGATFIIRREAIEITTEKFATAEKAIRVYPVADLVIAIPPPGAFAQQQLLNQTGILGIAGALGQIGQLGQLGVIGQLQIGQLQIGQLQIGQLQIGQLQIGQLQIGQLQIGQLQIGQLQIGQLQIGQLQIGQIGQIQIGQIQIGQLQIGNIGQIGQIAIGQLGQLGQIGQLSQIGQIGQFGLQNNSQDRLLITLITQVVGTPKDWLPRFDPTTGQPINPLDPNATELDDRNQLGYYPPALALVVKGTTRIHSRAQGPQIPDPAGAAKGFFERAKHDPKGKPLDPKAIWQDAINKGVDDPGLIIACADFLALNQKWDHCAEFLKANLRQGIVVEPWVYEALAVALRESGGSPEEIERAEVSAADLRPLDARGLLRASQAMADQKRYDRAVAFCRQAATLQPNLSTPYSEALHFAELAEDASGMQWAAGTLLKQDWPTNSRELQARALQKADALVKKLEAKPERQDDARRLAEAVSAQRRRDLVIKLRYEGQADLDLKVTEPTGTVCWSLNRQSIGGGTLIGDNLADMTEKEKSETYLAAEAFSGDYQVDVYRVWGKPDFDKAQVVIIRQQGTKDEHEQLVTVDLSNPKPIKFRLDGGRRTEAAYVPPPSAQQQVEESLPDTNSDKVLYKLRNLSSSEVTGFAQNRNRGGSGGGTPIMDRPVTRGPETQKDDRVLYQTKLSSFVKDSMDLTAQAVLAADRRSVRVTVAPVYTPPSNTAPTAPTISNPILPGGP
jgi:hypothetical protein